MRLRTSIMKAIAELGINLARIVPVKAAEGHAVVEFHATVGDVQSVERNRISLAEILTQRQIKSRVLRQIISRVRLAGKRVAEAGAVIDVGRSIALPWQRHIASHIQRITLVVIEWRQTRRKRKIRQSAGNGSAAFRNLIGICQVDLSAMRDARRAQCEFPPADYRLSDRDREKQIRFA